MISFEKAYAIVRRKNPDKEIASCTETKRYFVFNVSTAVAGSKGYIVHKKLGIYREAYGGMITRKQIIRIIDIKLFEKEQRIK